MRLIRFFHSFMKLKVAGLRSPSFFITYGDDVSIKNIWNHSKSWRFNWEKVS